MSQEQVNWITKMRREIRRQNKSYQTEKAYINWVVRLQRYCDGLPFEDINDDDVVQYLNYLANEREVSASTQNQALCGIVFLFKQVMGNDLGELKGLKRAKEPDRLPTVLSRREVKDILSNMRGRKKLVAYLLYGSGLRVSEALRLRVKDLDFDNEQIFVRNSKGEKDRTTLLPGLVAKALGKQIKYVKSWHKRDKARGLGVVDLPKALDRKYPNAGGSIGWQYLFPSKQLSTNPRTGNRQRYHLSSSCIQKAIKSAVERANIAKRVTTHTFRHSFATHLLEDGYTIRTVQQLLGHKNVKTTMVYTHVMQSNSDISSPADALIG